MVTRASFLVEKREGGRERWRATKLVRSIYLALGDADIDRAAGLCAAVMAELRPLCEEFGAVTSTRIARAVQDTLQAAGYSAAARRYAGAAREHARRTALWADLCSNVAATGGPGPSGRDSVGWRGR